MLQTILSVAFLCWKLALVAGVVYLVSDMYSDEFLRYAVRRRLWVFFLVLVAFGLFSLFVMSPSPPTTARFWISWYFTDDVGTLMTAWGVVGFYKLLRFDARKAAPLP